MAYLEAMAFAMPVVGSSDGALKEFVTAGQNGFLIERDDFESVNACIHGLYHDRQRLLEIRELGQPPLLDDLPRRRLDEQLAKLGARFDLAAQAVDLGVDRAGLGLAERQQAVEAPFDLGSLSVSGRPHYFELPAPEAGGSISDYVMTPEGDIMVFELVRVTLGDIDSLQVDQRETLRAQLGAEYSGMVDTEFQQVLRDEADITVL